MDGSSDCAPFLVNMAFINTSSCILKYPISLTGCHGLLAECLSPNTDTIPIRIPPILLHIRLIKKHKPKVFLTIALITNNYLHDGVMSSVVHQTIHHMWLKGGTFYKEATRKEGAVIE